MAMSALLSRQGHRLLQLGVALLLFTSFEGFAIPYLAAPTLGRSVHTLSGFVAVLLLALGLVWPRLTLGASAARIAFWLLIYSSLITIASFVLAAVWGTGNTVMPLAAGNARGSDLQETVIMVVAYSGAPTGIIAFALILSGLRNPNFQPHRDGYANKQSESR
jgi:hydroxylaminobenzene mutase